MEKEEQNQAYITQIHESSSESLTTYSKQRIGFSDDKDGVKSLSIYCSDVAVSDQVLAEGISHLKLAFPEIATDPLCAEIARLAIKNGIGEKQFMDAIDNCITNHQYNCLHVADILSFDIRLKFYSSKEVIRICGSFGEQKDKDLFPRYGLIDGLLYCVNAAELANLPVIPREKILKKIREYEESRKKQANW